MPIWDWARIQAIDRGLQHGPSAMMGAITIDSTAMIRISIEVKFQDRGLRYHNLNFTLLEHYMSIVRGVLADGRAPADLAVREVGKALHKVIFRLFD